MPTTTSDRASAPPSTAPSLLDLVGISALAATAAIHTFELSGKTEETPYLGLGYLVMIGACVTAIVLLAHRDRRGWILGGLTAASTILGYVLTRTTGLPNAHGDVGNWRETIGVWSLLAEALIVGLAVVRVAPRRGSAANAS